jgi:hypothetical protein
MVGLVPVHGSFAAFDGTLEIEGDRGPWTVADRGRDA